MCRRPAVSASTRSAPRAAARSTASKITALGSPPSAPRTKSAPQRSAHMPSCSAAAARNVSPAAMTTVRPSSVSRLPSLPMVVVLPTPLTPTNSHTTGRRRPGAASRSKPARRSFSSALSASSSSPRSVSALGLHPGPQVRRAAPWWRLDADIGADQRLLELVPGLVVDPAPGDRSSRRSPRASTGPCPGGRGTGAGDGRRLGGRHGLVDRGGQLRRRPRSASVGRLDVRARPRGGRRPRLDLGVGTPAAPGRRLQQGRRRGDSGCARGRASVPTMTPSTATRMIDDDDMRARAYRAASDARRTDAARWTPGATRARAAGRRARAWTRLRPHPRWARMRLARTRWPRVGLGGLLGGGPTRGHEHRQGSGCRSRC